MLRRPIARGSTRHAIHPSHAAFTESHLSGTKYKSKLQKENSLEIINIMELG
jgi:hypothetical protein